MVAATGGEFDHGAARKAVGASVAGRVDRDVVGSVLSEVHDGDRRPSHSARRIGSDVAGNATAHTMG